jgi:hypothetical protein
VMLRVLELTRAPKALPITLYFKGRLHQCSLLLATTWILPQPP